MGLRVVPHVCTETLPTVIGELVRMLPTVGLVRRADYPQCEGSVLPRDSHLGCACTMCGYCSKRTATIAFKHWTQTRISVMGSLRFLKIDAMLVCGVLKQPGLQIGHVHKF